MSIDRRLRAFVSYTHEDLEICNSIRAALERANFRVWSDADLRRGADYFDQIKYWISHVHVFMPILTQRSRSHEWVHQEIGYAVAMGTPIVPVCINESPVGMISISQGITLDEQLTRLEEEIAKTDFSGLVEEKASPRWFPPGQVAKEPETRARMIGEWADEAFRSAGAGCVRIDGGLSTFALPDEPPDDRRWKAAYGMRPRGQYAYELLREEHRALRRHAVEAGLRMIVHIGLNLDTERGPGVTRTRLCLLRTFLASGDLPDDDTVVAVVREHSDNVRLAVGDWFYAESQSVGLQRGILHTIFIAHAPTVGRCVAEFDKRLASLLAEQRIQATASKRHAIEQISVRIAELPPHQDWTCHGLEG